MIGRDRQRHGLITALVASAMVGPGLSYGPVYAFHVILAIAWVWLLHTEGFRGIITRLKEDRLTVIFMSVSFGWWCISLLWAPGPQEAIMAIIYWALGFALVLGLILLIQGPSLLRVAFWSAGCALAVEIGLGILG